MTAVQTMFQCLLLSALWLSPAGLARAEAAKPPRDFKALFNGKDLAGWHGMPHFDPYKLDKMSQEKRKEQVEKWTEEAKKHWRVKDGELINDGKGPYLTSDREFGDIELLLEYKTVP